MAAMVDLPSRMIRFANPQPMKQDEPGRWVTGGNDGVSTFLRDERADVQPTPALPARRVDYSGPWAVYAASFWRTNVRTVVWTTLGLRRLNLPAEQPIAYYLEEERDIVLFLDDAELVYFNNPLDWTNQ
jgi:hypothetical protein